MKTTAVDLIQFPDFLDLNLDREFFLFFRKNWFFWTKKLDETAGNHRNK